MYNIIAEIVVIASFTYGLSKLFPNEFKIINKKVLCFLDFCKFVCESETNPFLYCSEVDNTDEDTKTEYIDKEKYNPNEKKYEIVKEKFEDKYVTKFKTFTNDFYFNETELEEEQKEYEKIKKQNIKNKQDTINDLVGKLNKINEIEKNGGISKDTENFTKNINKFGIETMLEYFDLKEEYEDDEYTINFEELYTTLIKEKVLLVNTLKEINEITISENELKEIARKTIIANKLDKFIDNYVLEHTPIGNVFMRYNNSKGSFEYFSNNTIPYKYLETVGRKYVMTYWCKSIFVDIDEELKRAAIKYNDDMTKEQAEMKTNINKNIIAKMKNYNKDTKNHIAIQPMKNRSSGNIHFSPQIKATIQNVNQLSEKQPLKEKANRYTWEGRLSDFCPLKKIDKQVVNKSLSLTYEDFKRIQKETQNKK